MSKEDSRPPYNSGEAAAAISPLYPFLEMLMAGGPVKEPAAKQVVDINDLRGYLRENGHSSHAASRIWYVLVERIIPHVTGDASTGLDVQLSIADLQHIAEHLEPNMAVVGYTPGMHRLLRVWIESL